MRTKMSKLTLACVPIIACGGGGGGGGPDAHIILHDSTSIDAPKACTAAMTYAPTFGSNGQKATNHPASGSGSNAIPHRQTWIGGMNADQDVLDIELYAGFGSFTGGDIKTGTFPLTSENLYSTCGACVLIVTNVTMTTIGDWYMATGGSLTLSSVSGNLTGTLSNVTFAHVGSDAMGAPTDTAVGDCNSAVSAASFNTPLIAGSAAAAFSNEIADLPVVIHHRVR
jgi:hypothetical protein